MVHDHSVCMHYGIYDDELDLSFEDLDEVPIECIKCFSKVTIVDLSHNNIQSLTNEFATCFENLQHLDLSYNSISKLPENFKILTSLRHLDLSFNEIRQLDVGISCLKNLEWLNLNGNKLIPILKEVIAAPWGVDDKYSCAKSVVQFFTQVDTFANSTAVSPKESGAGLDTRVEVLFSRTKAQMTANELGIKDEEGQGVLVEDHNGQFFYVTFGKSLKDLRQKGSEKELSTGPMLSQAGLTKPKPPQSKIFRNIKRTIRAILGIFGFVSLCIVFLALTVYPKTLKNAVSGITDGLYEKQIIETFLQCHSWIYEKFQYFSIFPVSPPLPPSGIQGIWSWIVESVANLFYALSWNFRTKT